MGYIRLDVVHENTLKKFVFIHGAFIDSIWSAKFIDESNCIIATFEAEDLVQCLRKFAGFLSKYGMVINIDGDCSEEGSIEILYENLQQLS